MYTKCNTLPTLVILAFFTSISSYLSKKNNLKRGDKVWKTY